MSARDVEESPSLVGSWTSKRPEGEARSGMEDRFHGAITTLPPFHLHSLGFRALHTST